MRRYYFKSVAESDDGSDTGQNKFMAVIAISSLRLIDIKSVSGIQNGGKPFQRGDQL